MKKVTSFWCYKLSSYCSKLAGPLYEINLYVFCISLFMSISVPLPHHCDILLSHFMYFNSSCFLVYAISEEQLFPHRDQSIISFLCCALPSPLLFLCLPFCLCSVSSLFLSLISLLLLSLMFLFVLSLHPSCQAEWGAPLGRCWQTATRLFGGLCQVGTPTEESFISLYYISFRVVCIVPLSKVRKMKVPHNSGSIC